MATLEQKDRLIKELRGVQRIVINKCHGGFGLSHEGVLYYLDLCGVPVWTEINDSLIPFSYWLVPPGPERVSDQTDNWQNMSMAERQAHNQKWEQQTFSDRNIARDDPHLVRTVLDLGDRANSRFSELAIVEVPGDVEWKIEEYDGREWVAEVHRTWS
jgi:hypothetical protein